MTRKKPLTPGVTHGLRGTMNNFGCHCQECRAGNALAMREGKERRRLRLLADPTLAPHGRPSTYGNWGCRCTPCTDAWTVDTTARAQRRRERKRQASPEQPPQAG